ncbi:MAG: PAS domain S-box protein [Dehalococcoidia bacterium]|nr:PAS domain S-box protein [Dehalococcoidia bacterium]
MGDSEHSIGAELLVDQDPDAVIYAGTDGIIQVWNEAATRVFGFEAAAAIGQSLDIIIPQGFREAHWTGYDRALAAGDTKYRGQSLPTRAAHASGSEIYVELSFAIVKTADGTVIGAMATARDITERFQKDREMRRELRELKKAAEAAAG